MRYKLRQNSYESRDENEMRFGPRVKIILVTQLFSSFQVRNFYQDVSVRVLHLASLVFNELNNWNFTQVEWDEWNTLLRRGL